MGRARPGAQEVQGFVGQGLEPRGPGPGAGGGGPILRGQRGLASWAHCEEPRQDSVEVLRCRRQRQVPLVFAVQVAGRHLREGREGSEAAGEEGGELEEGRVCRARREGGAQVGQKVGGEVRLQLRVPCVHREGRGADLFEVQVYRSRLVVLGHQVPWAGRPGHQSRHGSRCCEGEKHHLLGFLFVRDELEVPSVQEGRESDAWRARICRQVRRREDP
mmetsp:Transcript_100447/g.262429  ORF Transcript_100447/g.262429 Transcript_100447/m.262429 type:complete len:218 (-) Transcript_100447:1065-1718(-)